MATTTPNFGWPVPTSTDLVKDGATAIEALGDSIDASLLDLKGGTTGQVLSKTTSTDMDFTWVTSDDANAIQNTIVDAKGDLISASAADTPARLAVGSNGETLVADSSTSTGLRYQGNFAAGKNKIINGDFNIWQRGTSFSTAGAYTADRFYAIWDGTGTKTISQQTFSPGTAPVAGYESQYYLRFNQTVAGTGGSYNVLTQRIEDVRTFAGQTVTVTFWAKSASTTSFAATLVQNFGSGGSGSVTTSFIATTATTTGWVRYTGTASLPSIAGKTVGTSSYLELTIILPINATFTLDFWGVQVEASNTATAFQTATGTIQGELAACQRYYYRATVDTFNKTFGLGQVYSTTQAYFLIQFPVTMRSIPSALEQNGTAADYRLNGATFNQINLSSIVTFNSATSATSLIIGTVASGLVAGNATSLMSTASNAFLGWSAEL